MRDEFVQLLAANYAAVKTQYPDKGRRYWHLRALDKFWQSGASHPSGTGHASATADEFMHDLDPFDGLIEDADGLGILVRTDFSDEEAWQGFVQKLEEAEKDMAEAMAPERDEDVAMDGPESNNANAENKNEEENEESDEDESPNLIYVLDPSAPDAPAKREPFMHISNLTALRLFNDADIRPAAPPPSGTKRANLTRLIDRGGWVEVYSGKTLWIYDKQSNQDQCTRLVSQEPDASVYGTATGDSWRARVTHIPELQFNMSVQGMQVNFGGLDRWDYSERARNIEEAAATSNGEIAL